MFFADSETPQALSTSVGVRIALVLTAAATIVIGILPEPFLRMAASSLGR